MSTEPATTTDNRKFIHSPFEIERALANDYVYCHIKILAPGKRFVVRDVRKKNGSAEVLVLEGWYKPDEVFTESID